MCETQALVHSYSSFTRITNPSHSSDKCAVYTVHDALWCHLHLLLPRTYCKRHNHVCTCTVQLTRNLNASVEYERFCSRVSMCETQALVHSYSSFTGITNPSHSSDKCAVYTVHDALWRGLHLLLPNLCYLQLWQLFFLIYFFGLFYAIIRIRMSF